MKMKISCSSLTPQFDSLDSLTTTPLSDLYHIYLMQTRPRSPHDKTTCLARRGERERGKQSKGERKKSSVIPPLQLLAPKPT